MTILHREIFIDANGCWLWQGSKNRNGYGTLFRNGRVRAAHREMWVLYNNPLYTPDRTLLVCHTCDVRACINPNHLYLGTPTDNVRDMYQRGRRTKKTPVPKNPAPKPRASKRRACCIHGHPYTPDNTLWVSTGNGRKKQRCRTCRKIQRSKS